MPSWNTQVCLPVTTRLGSTDTHFLSYCWYVIFLAPLLVAHGPLSPFMISPECCDIPPPSVHLHFLCHLVGFHFVILDRYTAPSFVMAQAMLEVDDLKGRSVHELAANGWKLITYHSVY